MQDNTTATLAIPVGLSAATAAHWLPVHLDLKAKGGGGGGGGGGRLDRLTDAELGPFAPGARNEGDEGGRGDGGDVTMSTGRANDVGDASGGSDQQQEPAPQQAPNAGAGAASTAAAGSAPASAALKATLRGRALAGARWPLPPGVGGLVLEPAPDLDVQAEEAEDDEEGMDDDDCGYGDGRRQEQQGQQQGQQRRQSGARPAAAPRQRSWRAVAAFSELVAWNHDAAPAPTDAAWRLMDFLAVSAAAHGFGGLGGGGAEGAAAAAAAPLPPITAADVDAEVLAVLAAGARPPDAVRARPGPVE